MYGAGRSDLEAFRLERKLLEALSVIESFGGCSVVGLRIDHLGLFYLNGGMSRILLLGFRFSERRGDETCTDVLTS